MANYSLWFVPVRSSRRVGVLLGGVSPLLPRLSRRLSPALVPLNPLWREMQIKLNESYKSFFGCLMLCTNPVAKDFLNFCSSSYGVNHETNIFIT